jgi:hypothetical protein
MQDDVARKLASLFPAIQRRYGSCGRKIAYADLGTALSVKETREQRCLGLTLHLYQCPYAEHWHLTSHQPSPSQQAKQWAEMTRTADELDAALGALDRTIQALWQQEAALLKAMAARSRVLLRLPSPRRVTEAYEAQRDDLIRLDECWSRRLDAQQQFNELTIIADAVILRQGPPTAAGYRSMMDKLSRVAELADTARDDKALHVTEALETLTAQYHEQLRQVREDLNQGYALPSFSWRRA